MVTRTHNPPQPILRKSRQEDQKLKVVLSYLANSRPPWAHETLSQKMWKVKKECSSAVTLPWQVCDPEFKSLMEQERETTASS